MIRKHLALAFALALVPALAYAACPAGKTPADALDGRNQAMLILSGRSATGTLLFQPGGTVRGLLTIIDSVNSGTYRQAPVNGRWMLGPNCENGMLTFGNSIAGWRFDFVTLLDDGTLFSFPPDLYGTSRPTRSPGYVPPPIKGLPGVDQDGNIAFSSR